MDQKPKRKTRHYKTLRGSILFKNLESKKMIQMNLFTEQKQTHRHRKQTWLLKGKRKWGGYKLGVWD